MRVTSEQLELRDLVRRFLSERVTSEYLRERIRTGNRYDPELRDACKQLGLYETFSGAEPGCSVVELGLLAEECGRFLVPDALVENVLTNSLLESLLAPEERHSFGDIVQAADGACFLAYASCCDFALAEGESVITGVTEWVAGGAAPLALVGFVTTDSGRRGFLAKVPHAEGACSEVTSLDLTTPLQRISLTGAHCAVLSAQSTEALEVALEIVKASEISGLCQRVMEMTVEYVKTRQQFGVPVGSFQAIQQKLAQAHAETEALASLCRFAAWSFNSSPEQRRLTARAAILKAADLGPQVCETAIQCHGGIGFTWEYDLHLYLRRAKVVQAAFGINEESATEMIGAIA
jgi:alkylation response protein AidB-like acyl-CoA dehydrogenase